VSFSTHSSPIEAASTHRLGTAAFKRLGMERGPESELDCDCTSKQA